MRRRRTCRSRRSIEATFACRRWSRRWPSRRGRSNPDGASRCCAACRCSDWSLEKSQRVYWGISAHIGRPISQSPLGDLTNAVTDRGFKKDDPNYRANRGRGELFFHSDFADVVGLLCVRPAKVGRGQPALQLDDGLQRTAENRAAAHRHPHARLLLLSQEGRGGRRAAHQRPTSFRCWAATTAS